MSKRIAVIGSGVSGLGAIYGLRNTGNSIDLYEKDDRIGGHAHTVTVSVADETSGTTPTIHVDSGFIVYNDINYPNFKAFIKAEDVETTETDMSLSVQRPSGFEWSGHNLGTVFSHPTAFRSARTWRMVFDIARFNATALKALSTEKDDMTLGEYLEKYKFGEGFIHDYLLPMTAAVWSMPASQCADMFPLKTLVRFLWNHHLLNTITDRPKWKTVQQGSEKYVEAILAAVKKGKSRTTVFTGEGVAAVEKRFDGKLVVKLSKRREEIYDAVVFATHAHQALKLYKSAPENTASILCNFRVSSNDVILHTDPSFMPQIRANWSAWNFLTPPDTNSTVPPTVTYWMNLLQPHLPASPSLFVTLNPTHPPSPSKVIQRFIYDHPIYTPAAIAAQSPLSKIQGEDNVYFAGAWTKFGFHEDGFTSGLRAAVGLGGCVEWGEVVDAGEIREVREGWGEMVVRWVLGVVQWVVLGVVVVCGGKDGKETAKKVD